MIKTVLLKVVTPETLRGVNGLLPMLSPKAEKLTLGDLRKIVKDKNTLLFTLQEGGKIVGMAVLVFLFTPTGPRARIEDVVIDWRYREKGLGLKLTKKLVREAKKRKARYIDLTSQSGRVAANALYEKLGFRERDTRVYRLPL